MNLFHKIGIGLKRTFASKSIKTISEEKSFGNHGETEVENHLRQLLPSISIKSNVIVSIPQGRCEIDLLVSYESKIFIIEVKNWVGELYEQGKYFRKEKIDKWTGETYRKTFHSPFGQVKRQAYLLKEQTKSNPWINTIVFFANAESVETTSENIWFTDIKELVEYIRSDGYTSKPKELKKCFDNAIAADLIYSPPLWGERSLHCLIREDSLTFIIDGKTITKKDMIRIYIYHHFTHDNVVIFLNDGNTVSTTLENYEIVVEENGYLSKYSFAKINTIIIGK